MSWVEKMLGLQTLESLECVIMEQLKDLYSAEQQLVDALPNMVEAAHSATLKKAFQDHLQQTKVHVRRLEEVFHSFNKEPEAETCQAMRGLISEASSIASMGGDSDAKDAALIAAAQRVEHYEIAAYGCCRSFANHLGNQRAVLLLNETLQEEGAADKKLTQIADSFINQMALAGH